jgi:hypothetical protein
MLNFFTLEEPFNLILIIPIFVSLATTSKFHIKSLNVTLLFLFCFFFIQYVESYIILILLALFLSKNFILKLIKKKYKFTDLQKEIYHRDFSLLTEEEFTNLFENARMISTKSQKHLMTTGDRLDKVYYFAQVPPPSVIHLKMKNTIISYIREGSWIGIVEFLLYINNMYHDKYLVELSIGKNKHEIVYFEWDVSVYILLNDSIWIIC